MIVYEVRCGGGEYEEKFDFTLGIYDSLELAVAKCLEEIETVVKRTVKKIDFQSVATTEVYVNSWELNGNEEESYVKSWWRRKDGTFVIYEEWDDDNDWGYDPDKVLADELRKED